MKVARNPVTIILALSVVLLDCCVTTGKSEVPISIEVTEYGIYTCEKVATISTQEASAGIMTTAKDFRLIETTDQIAMEKGTLFGITVSYENPKYKSIEITLKILHPEMDDPYLKKAVTVSTLKWPIRSGVPAHFGYIPKEAYEMVRGSWTFEIWYMNELSCSKTFSLY
jgi:hypothetical protein